LSSPCTAAAIASGAGRHSSGGGGRGSVHRHRCLHPPPWPRCCRPRRRSNSPPASGHSHAALAPRHRLHEPALPHCSHTSCLAAAPGAIHGPAAAGGPVPVAHSRQRCCMGMHPAVVRVLAIFCNLTQYLCISMLSPTSFQVLGNMKTVLVLVLGWMLFDSSLTPANVVGMAMAVSGMVLYSYAAHGKGNKGRTKANSASADASEKKHK
ncbi:hypothetical protein CLOP_g7165, partial [Closterium sp. NIES-67]